MTPRAPSLPPEHRHARPQLERNASSQSKLSLPASSQSNEADDEFSDRSFDMESTAAHPQYDGEDTRLTSDKELSGFYVYGWAAEVCVLCSLCMRHRTSIHLVPYSIHCSYYTTTTTTTTTGCQLTHLGLCSMRHWFLHSRHPRAARPREWRTSPRPHHALQGFATIRSPSY